MEINVLISIMLTFLTLRGTSILITYRFRQDFFFYLYGMLVFFCVVFIKEWCSSDGLYKYYLAN